MIEESKISSVDSLLRKLNSLPNNYIYRGHASSMWGLESTLQRMLGTKWSRETAAKFEKHALDKFKSKYNIYRSGEHEPNSKLAWLSVMQHYGVPTQLIDFTESPYIALYFALEAYSLPSQDDLAIYALDYTAIMEVALKHVAQNDKSFKKDRFQVAEETDLVFDEVVDRFSYEMLWVTEPLELNARIDRQAGTFLLSGDAENSVEDLLSSKEYERCKSYKFVIDRGIYEGVFALLRKMNINSKTIYGDLAGLAKSIRMDLQAYAI